jgi:5-methyltetrahydrofolate--homocysteine methyltransferase
VFADAQSMLKRIIEGRWLTANGVLGFYPANAVGDDDIALYTDDTRSTVAMTWHGLRQQTEKHLIDGVMRPSRCLADFVAPSNTLEIVSKSDKKIVANNDTNSAKTPIEASILSDYIGVFAVTTGLGSEKREKIFTDAHDDYSAILLKALADRLAEAFAEYLHQRARKDLWGYAAQESLSVPELIAEKYQGIRPAPGYPACPDHSVKRDMFELLQCQDIGMAVTESLAMTPAASVSGFFISHPDSVYFNVGKVSGDQVEDLARRKGMPQREVERLLAPNL